MKRTIIATEILVLLFAAASCARPTRPIAARPEYRPEVERARGVYDDALDALVPGMSAEAIVAREKSQQAFEDLCLRAARPGAEDERVALCAAIAGRLGPETAKPARVWMLRQLERIGGEECVATLAELLDDEDPRIRELSRRALQHNAAPSAAEPLRAALDRAKDLAWQVALINALAARRDQQSVSRLAKLAQAADAQVASAAVVALGRVGGTPAIEALYAIWRGEGDTGPHAAAAALIRTAERLVHSGEGERAARIFEDIYASSIAGPLRVAALHGLALAKREAALPRLLGLMQGDDPEMRERAARFALDIPGRAVTFTLATVLFDMPPAVQVTLLGGLSERGGSIARPATLRATKSPEQEVRVAAVRALARVGDSSTVVLLAKTAAGCTDAGAPGLHVSQEERQAGRQSLNLLAGEGVDETILAAVQKQTDPAVRCELIKSLAARWYRPAIPALFAATEDPVETVRVAAFDALGVLALEDHLPGLVRRLLDIKGDDAREAAEGALVEVSSRIDDPEQGVGAVLAVLDDADGTVEASLIRVLGRIGGAEALQAIRAARQVEDTDVVDAAVRALADWPDPEVNDDLLVIARTSPSETHRVLALRGYVRLVRLPSEREPVETFKMFAEAMALATRAEEKTLVLGGLAEVRHINALEMVEAQLGDEALRDEAGVAMLKIARALAAENREAALAAIEKVRATAAGEELQRQVDEAAEFIERFAGYSAAWVLAGPYMEEGKKSADLFAIVFPPEAPDAPDVEWTALAINNRDNPWAFDLARAIGGVSRCAYVRTRVWVEKQQSLRLEIGSDDSVKAWLNGQPVHSNLAYRGLTPGEDKVTVTLDEGWNTLMLKIVQGDGGWGFSAGLRALDGSAPDGLRFRAD